MRSLVEGASDSPLHFRRRTIVETDAPSTAQVRGPPPPLAWGRKTQCTTMVVAPMPSRSTRPNRMAAWSGSSRTQPCDAGPPSCAMS